MWKFFISFCLLKAALSTPEVVINEVKPALSTDPGRVEILNCGTTASTPNLRLFVFGSNGARLQHESVDAVNPDELSTIQIDFLVLKRCLIVLYDTLGSLSIPSTLGDVVPAQVRDSFSYSNDPTDVGTWPAPFTLFNGGIRKTDELSGDQSFQRCCDDKRKNNPDPFDVIGQSLDQPNVGCLCDNVSDDPHFFQSVIDSKTKEIFQLCYDVVGKTGQSIDILSDSLSETKVKGILLDDYYFHEIIVNHMGKLIRVTRKTVSFGEQMFDWIERNTLLFENVRISMMDDKVKIETFFKMNNLTTIVKRSSTRLGVHHLDVYFERLEKTKNRYGGLLGDIGNKDITMSMKAIQSDSDVSLLIEDNIVRGRINRRSHVDCVLLPVDHLIHPKLISEYVY